MVSRLLVAASFATLAGAQSLVMSLPRASQRAVVSQRIALTDITITYHRPLVGGRKIWGGIVPYGQVWRAGANENTVFEVTSDVTVEGKPLVKGAYGLHMIPAADSFTLIFSKNSTSWGSFTYDQVEDALRVTVKPHPAELREALSYEFDDMKNDSAVAILRWESLAVPFHIAVGSPEVTFQSIRDQLRNSAQYTWQGWYDAAEYARTAKVNLEEGLKWADRSVQSEERFENVIGKMQILEALHRETEATAARSRAFEIGSANQVYFFGRQLQTEKRKADAIAVFRIVAKRFPQHWLGHIAQARAYVAEGNFEAAVKEVKAAQALGVPDVQKPNLETLIRRLENKEDINA